jgi:negative regulator of sigma E activity
MAASATISYAGTVEVVGIGDERSEASVYRIEHRPPNLTERVYLSPPALQGDSVLSRGDETYFVDPHRHRILRTVNDSSDDQIARDGNYLLMRSNYQAVKKPSESLDGRGVRIVALVNRYTERTTMLVRIDEQTKLILDKQQFASNGALISEVRFESVGYRTDMPDGDFQVPKSFAVVQGPRFSESSQDVPQIAKAAGYPLAPKVLPDGFSPVEGRVLQRQGARTLHLLYSDGIRTVSLFETDQASAPDFQQLHPQAASVGGHVAEYAEHGPTTLLSWTDGTLHCTLVGELTVDELRRIAESIRY